MDFREVCCNEIKQNFVGIFCLNCTNDGFTVVGTSSETYIFEMSPNDSIRSFPFKIQYIKLSRQHPCEFIFKDIHLQAIYTNANILEKTEISLDPLYAAGIAEDIISPQAVQVCRAPSIVSKSTLAIVTSWGTCEILQKKSVNRCWGDLRINVNKYVQWQSLEPTLPKNVKTFKELKAVIDSYCVTAFTWTESDLFYIGNASGWIVALTLKISQEQVENHCRIYTDLGKITYLKMFGNLLLAGGSTGVVKVFNLSNLIFNLKNISNRSTFHPTKIQSLWNKCDNLTVRHAEVTFNNLRKDILVVFSKGPQLLFFRLSSDGKVEGKCSFQAGMVITGLQKLRDEEFIVVTIDGVVRVICLQYSCDGELKISDYLVQTNFDRRNYQILGVASSPNKFLWSFALFRNKEYTHHSKCVSNSIFMSVCNLNIRDAFEFLLNTTVPRLDPYLDCTEAFRLEILNNMSLNKYYNYSAFDSFWDIDEILLRKLQLRLLIVNSILKYQKDKYKNIKRKFIKEAHFLYIVIQVVQITCRLKHLNSFPISSLSDFQLLASKCLKSKFSILVKQKSDPLGNYDNEIRETLINKCSSLISDFDIVSDKPKENCSYCSKEINLETMVCSDNHQMPRCCISYVQVPEFYKRYCPDCRTVTLDEDSFLLTLIDTEEQINCIFCRCSFKSINFL